MPDNKIFFFWREIFWLKIKSNCSTVALEHIALLIKSSSGFLKKKRYDNISKFFSFRDITPSLITLKFFKSPWVYFIILLISTEDKPLLYTCKQSKQRSVDKSGDVIKASISGSILILKQ